MLPKQMFHLTFLALAGDLDNLDHICDTLFCHSGHVLFDDNSDVEVLLRKLIFHLTLAVTLTLHIHTRIIDVTHHLVMVDICAIEYNKWLKDVEVMLQRNFYNYLGM